VSDKGDNKLGTRKTIHHRIRGTAALVGTMTSKVNRETETLTPGRRSETPEKCTAKVGQKLDIL